MQNAEPVRRNTEIEEVSNLWFIHPVSSRLTLLFRDLHVPANAVSLCGMGCGILAGFAYYHWQDWRFACAGFVLMVLWHVMDGADGQLARLTNTQSETGRILDGVCDYVTFIAVYVSLALRLAPVHGGFVWGLAVMAGLCHAIQAGGYEVQRQEYEFWGYGRASKDILKSRKAAPDAPAPLLSRVLDGFYERMQFAAIGSTVAFHERLAAVPQTDAMRARYRAVFAPAVRRWALLCANYRTLAIFVFVMLRIPVFYFVYEIVGLSLVMALLSWRQRGLFARFLAK